MNERFRNIKEWSDQRDQDLRDASGECAILKGSGTFTVDEDKMKEKTAMDRKKLFWHRVGVVWDVIGWKASACVLACGLFALAVWGITAYPLPTAIIVCVTIFGVPTYYEHIKPAIKEIRSKWDGK